MAPRIMEAIERMPIYAGRKSSASPAVGSLAVHKHEQARLVKSAFEL
ncbi:MAG: hypothetical protein ACN4GF_10380 [Lentimonas sp.]